MAVLHTLQFLVFLYFACMSFGQPTTVSQTGCSYTFLVPNQEDNSCPAGSAVHQEDIEGLKSMVLLLSQNVLKLQEEIALMKSTEGSDEGSNTSGLKIGTNYVRWGRKSCPDTAELIYEGYSAKSHYTHSGGGVNYICLDKNPEWPDVTTAGFQSNGHIYGVEYETLTGLDSSLLDNDAPCAVCHVDGRGEHLMIPGKRTCPTNWTKEYEGLLVSDKSNHKKATYVCLDGKPEVIAGGGENKNGGLFYTVEVDCGYSLPCPPYQEGFEIACVVCTH